MGQGLLRYGIMAAELLPHTGLPGPLITAFQKKNTKTVLFWSV